MKPMMNEMRADWMKRCMGDATMMSDMPMDDKRMAACEIIWNDSGKAVLNSLKAISQTDTELRVGNYMVLFGGKDLTGEFFTKKTHFDSNFTDLGVLYVDFEHGRDAEKAGNSQHNVLGIADWKSAKVDDTGIFIERVLNRRAEYMKYLMQLIDAGIMGTSSEAIPGTPRKKSSGEIIEWPLMRDSLTVTPMEPRMLDMNVLTAAKALYGMFPNSKSLALLTGAPENERKTLSEREFERLLTQDAGFTRSEARLIMKEGFKSFLVKQDADDEGMQRAAEALRCATAVLHHSI